VRVVRAVGGWALIAAIAVIFLLGTRTTPGARILSTGQDAAVSVWDAGKNFADWRSFFSSRLIVSIVVGLAAAGLLFLFPPVRNRWWSVAVLGGSIAGALVFANGGLLSVGAS
jgi:hypothetical protein